MRTQGGWVYLAVVLDLYDRKVIGWALNADLETVHKALSALDMALKNRQARRPGVPF